MILNDIDIASLKCEIYNLMSFDGYYEMTYDDFKDIFKFSKKT